MDSSEGAEELFLRDARTARQGIVESGTLKNNVRRHSVSLDIVIGALYISLFLREYAPLALTIRGGQSALTSANQHIDQGSFISLCHMILPLFSRHLE